MSFTVLPGSHVDHVSPEVLAYIKQRFEGRTGNIIETFELPAEFGQVPTTLYGPANGDPPVGDDEVFYQIRNGRKYPSRMVDRPVRMTRIVTVIAGPGKDRVTGQEYDCVMYTCFGGPFAEKEVHDPRVEPEHRERIEAFWAVHALALPTQGPRERDAMMMRT